MTEVQSPVNPLGIVGHKKAVPSADDLLSIKLLAENDEEFKYLKQEATVYLKSALMMLNNSPFLRSKFGGDGIPQASILAELVKQRTDTLNFQNHIDNMSRQLLSREMNKASMFGMEPIALPVYAANGVRYTYPSNILGLRNALESDNGDAASDNLRVLGAKKLDAYGNAASDHAPVAFNDLADLRRTNVQLGALAPRGPGNVYDIRHYM